MRGCCYITSRAMLAVVLVILVFCSCGKDTKKMDDRITFKRRDKRPYGTWVAYEGLRHIFPNAEISGRAKNVIELSSSYGKHQAMIFVGFDVTLGSNETDALLSFIGRGNHVLLSSMHFGDSLLHALDIRVGGNAASAAMGLQPEKDSLTVSVDHPVTGDSLAFTYPGKADDDFADSLDLKYATVLGRDGKGRPNFIQYTYKGGGSLLIHFAPMALTNFFLLHKNNMTYYDNVLSYIPKDVTDVTWNDGYTLQQRDRDSGFQSLGFIMKNRQLRTAFWLLVGLLLVVYLFESKRRQRIVPVIEGLRNTSLDFVVTIGRLYFQRRDNQNLVTKMAAHFMDHIRTRYNLTIHLSDPGFVERLAYKTGITPDFLHILTGDIMRLQDSPSVSDEELLELNKKLEEFYKKA